METIVGTITEKSFEINARAVNSPDAIILKRPAIWFTNENPVLALGQFGYETNTGKLKQGDGVTEWNDLEYLPTPAQIAAKADRTSGKTSGGNIQVNGLEVTVEAVEYYIVGLGSFSAEETDPPFTLTLSSAGKVRYVGFYGDLNGDIVKVEGDEGASATYPETPADHAPIGFVLVSDGAIGTPEDPGTVNFADIGQNASDNASLVAYVLGQRYLPLRYHWTTANLADATTYYIGTAGLAPGVSATNTHGVAPLTGTIFAVGINTRNNTAGSTEAVTFVVSINNAGLDKTITTTYVFNNAVISQQFIEGLNIAVTKEDSIFVKMITPTWGTNPTNTAGTVVLYMR